MKENTQVKKKTGSCISLETNLGIWLFETFWRAYKKTKSIKIIIDL